MPRKISDHPIDAESRIIPDITDINSLCRQAAIDNVAKLSELALV